MAGELAKTTILRVFTARCSLHGGRCWMAVYQEAATGNVYVDHYRLPAPTVPTTDNN